MDYLLYTESDILERVDEYTLYCHFLSREVIIGTVFLCPDEIRSRFDQKKDNTPSFGIYERRNAFNSTEFMWKDQAIGIWGDIFDLVKLLYNFNTKLQAMHQICAEFGLGGLPLQKPIITLERKIADPADIYIKSRPFRKSDSYFWSRFNIMGQSLERYKVTPFTCYWMNGRQRTPLYPSGGTGYAYHIESYYQLYFPFSELRENRFRVDWTDRVLPGLAQLRFQSDTCIITKSYKDIMCVDSFGYEVVGVRSENVMLHPDAIAFLKKKYRRILCLFDNDGKHNGDDYEFDKIFVPKDVEGDKDPSDYCSNHGAKQTELMLKSIIG